MISTLQPLAATWILALLCPLAFAAETGSRDGGDSTPFKPYLSVGAAVISPENVRFMDGADSSNAALYGNENIYDAGTIEDGLQGRVAAGIRFNSAFRLQLEYGLTRDVEYSGNTNYDNSGELQPSTAILDTRQVLVAAFRDFPPWEYAPDRVVRPFLGVGAGFTKFRLGNYRQRFPDPPNPDGPLRRGPGGEIPYTALPPGSDRNFTYMLTAGIAIPVGEHAELDLSYRYADAGEIHTNIGEIEIVRYRRNGSRREIPVPINETSADFRTHSLSLSLRFEW
ncbi:MAG: porin family protein [Gammaproteobacteria bacterium]|nr:outer membrane beta-barrel protein [Gammaproteobacteria bacterium]MXY89516.1 porin family protein [Gammaproteobacteria bacterium]MYA35652.1 porin family protein [Gammaproteobacteria bacterium]MYG96873.1 porin family protein [Gammaproteobacteria bacterium]MYH84995.1 porin family protein [Gammaproteobacteria bacterium]